MSGGLWDPVFIVLRLFAAAGAAGFGWFITGPICRLSIRALVRKPAPWAIVFFSRPVGAAVLACLVFYFLPLGFGGGGGWGFGPGSGGAPGQHTSIQTESSQSTKSEQTTAPKREVYEIELIGGDRYQNDENFYLLQKRAPAVSIKEVEKVFAEKPGHLEVHIILTPDSVGKSHVAFQRLLHLADKYRMTTRKDPTFPIR